jgi:uncharacterized protein with ATP-grasp and redox domains
MAADYLTRAQGPRYHCSMRRAPECRPCVLGDLATTLELLQVAPLRRAEIEREGRAQFEHSFPENRIPGEHIADAHRLLKRALALAHPFADARARANQVGMELAARVAADAPAAPEERLRWFVRWAIAGNLLDFRICGYDLDAAAIAARLGEVFAEPLAIDDVPELAERMHSAREILFIHDNVGEVAFDMQLLCELRRQAPAARLTSALRGGVMTSDATIADGETVGLSEVAEVIATGPDTLGISFAEMSPELAAALARADLVIAKGQANFYVLEERPPAVPGAIALLLRTKCLVVSRHLGFDRIVSVARLLPPRQTISTR